MLTLADLIGFAQAEGLDPKDVNIVLLYGPSDEIVDLQVAEGSENNVHGVTPDTFVLEILEPEEA